MQPVSATELDTIAKCHPAAGNDGLQEANDNLDTSSAALPSCTESVATWRLACKMSCCGEYDQKNHIKIVRGHDWAWPAILRWFRISCLASRSRHKGVGGLRSSNWFSCSVLPHLPELHDVGMAGQQAVVQDLPLRSPVQVWAAAGHELDGHLLSCGAVTCQLHEARRTCKKTKSWHFVSEQQN